MADPFENSRRKIVRAHEHISDLEREGKLYWDSNPYKIVIEPDPQQPGHEIHKLRLTTPLPASFSSLTADAVHNLRSALDNACYEIAVGAGRVKPKHAAFPFAGSAIEFENTMRGRCRDIPEEIYPLFRAYQPYKGGNDLLWALNQVSNTDKHALLAVGLGSALGSMHATGGMIRMYINPPWDSVKQEIELGVFMADPIFESKYQIDFSVCLAFDDIQIVGGKAVVPVLKHFASVVQDIVAGIQAESRHLGFVK